LTRTIKYATDNKRVREAGRERDIMRHYSCDLCGKDLTLAAGDRYVVHVRVAPASETVPLTDADLQPDHVEAMAAFLEELENQSDPITAPDTAQLEYDLCDNCRRKYLADPLGRSSRTLRFSKN
jgi:hypothetical protein